MLSLDSNATTYIVQLASTAALGRPMDMRVKSIAGIVLPRRTTLATRSVWHFDDLGREALRQLNSQKREVVRVVGGLCYSTGTASDPVSAHLNMEPPLN